MAFPLLGAGRGGFDEARALCLMRAQLAEPGATEGLGLTLARLRGR